METKKEILNLLYQKDVMRTMHKKLSAGLIGPLMNEYQQSSWENGPIDFVKTPPMFRALVDMLVANVLHHLTEDLIEEVIDACQDIENTKTT